MIREVIIMKKTNTTELYNKLHSIVEKANKVQMYFGALFFINPISYQLECRYGLFDEPLELGLHMDELVKKYKSYDIPFKTYSNAPSVKDYENKNFTDCLF